MGIKHDQLGDSELVLNKWLQEMCVDMDFLKVNDIPILKEDCLDILTGCIAKIKNSTNKLVITTNDNMNYVLEAFN